MLKLYVWHEVLCDYTCGAMFALAESVEEARRLIVETGETIVDEDLEREPTVYETPVAFAIWGGG